MIFLIKKSLKLIFLASLLFLCTLDAGIRVENHKVFIDSAALCAILEDVYLIFPHKMAVGSVTDDAVRRNKELLGKTKEKFITDIQQLLSSSEQMRNDFKEYFDPHKKQGLDREVKELEKLYLALDPKVVAYSQRLRRLAIAELLSFLKEQVYQNKGFPDEYEQLYNEMIANLHYKMVVEKFRGYYGFSFPSREFNQGVIFKELEHVWNDYTALNNDDKRSVKKIIYLYKAYQLVSLVEGDLLGKDEKKRYCSIRSDCVSALEEIEKLENDPSLNTISEWFYLKNGKKNLSDQAYKYIEDNFYEPLESLFKHYHQRSSNVALKSSHNEKLLSGLGPLFEKNTYNGYVRLINYLVARANDEEKKIITTKLITGFQDWIGSTERISKEMPLLPPLKDVKATFEEELNSAKALSSVASYPCGSLLKTNGYNDLTTELIRLIDQNNISLKKTEFLPANYKADGTDKTNHTKPLSSNPGANPVVHHTNSNQKNRDFNQFMWLPFVALGIGTFTHWVLKKYRKKKPNEENQVDKEGQQLGVNAPSRVDKNLQSSLLFH